MITKNMIDAGLEVCKFPFDCTSADIIFAIYEAMTVQRQKDEKQAGRDFYDKHSHLVEGHSSR